MSKNFAVSTVVTPPSPATSGTTLTVQSGHGSRFYPGKAFIVPAGTTPDPTNSEVVTIGGPITTDTLTVTRAQESSAARTVVAGDVIYQGLTAAMWDAGGLPARTTATYTTAALSQNAAETGTVTLARGFRLLQVQTSAAARVRLYGSVVARTADASRPVGTDPTTPVILDYVTTGTSTVDLSPLVDGASTESTPSTAIPLRVTRTAAGSGTVAVTFTYIQTEA